MSLRGRLSRLGGGTPEPVTPSAANPASDRDKVLADLRERMQAVLERHEKKSAPREVDTTELPFLTEETPFGTRHRRVMHLPASHRVGRLPTHAAKVADANLLALFALDPAIVGKHPERALYLDTETTGLSGGAGTVAFLVGLAYWREGSFVLEQLLVRNLGEELPMLMRVKELVAEADWLVTFNGKSFDMPLLRARFTMARVEAPREPAHLDLLHVARRLHRARGFECKLTTLEREVLGFLRTDDIPSGEVSACYLHFLRTGDARGLLSVIEHNAMDVVGMAALVGLYGEELASTQLSAHDLVGVARTLHRAKKFDTAFVMADRAVEEGAGVEGLRVRAELAKARGDKMRALRDFESLAAQVDCPRTRLELAKLYEHHVKEPARALSMVERGTTEKPAASERRSRRLSGKVARTPQTKLKGVG